MQRLKDPHLPEYCNQLFNLHTVATKSTIQSAHSKPSLMKGKKVMQNESLQLQLQDLPKELKALENTVKSLQLQIQQLQKETVTNKNQWEYCSSYLCKHDIPTDEKSLEEHQNYSCGNHYDC